MEFYSIHELAEILRASRKTVERRLKKLDRDFLATFIQIGAKNKIMYSEHLIEALGGIIDPAKLLQRIPPKIELKKANPPKEKKVKESKPGKEPDAYIEPEPEMAVTISETDPPIDDRIKISNQIFQAYQMGSMLLRECAEAAGVRYEILQSWIVSDRRIFNAYAVAKEKFKTSAFENLHEIALVQIQRSISGHYADQRTEAGEIKIAPNGEKIDIPKEYKASKRYVPTRSDLLMFALTNRSPEEWRKIFTPLNEQQKPIDPLDQLTEAEMIEYLEKARQAGIGGEEKKI